MPKSKSFIKLFLILATPSLVLLFFGLPNTSLAAEDCQIETKLDELVSIKDNLELSTSDKETGTASARFDLMVTIINCSLEEISNLKTNLSNFKDLNESEIKIKDSFINKLDEFSKYFENQKEVLSEIKDDSTKVKNLAQQILTWRSKTYNPDTSEIVDFIFLFKQKESIATADARLSKIKTSLNKIFSLNNSKINSLLKKATDDIIKSKELREEAYNLFLTNLEVKSATTTPKLSSATKLDIDSKSITPAPTLLKNPTVKELSSDIPIEIIIPEPSPVVRDLIKESLGSIKSAYENFFDLSRVVKSLLGL